MEKTERELIVLPQDQRQTTYSPAFYAPESQTEQSALPVSQFLWTLRRQRWKICAFVVAAVAVTYIISSRITPIYEATATVDIDRQTPSGVVGQDATRTNAINDSDQFLATQVKLVQSDSVLRPVVRKYNLLEREQQFETPLLAHAANAEEAPVALKKLTVTRPSNTFLLLINYRSSDPQLAADVSNGIAQSYLERAYDLRIRSAVNLTGFMEKQIEELRAKMERSTAALIQFERELNVINPEDKTNILSSRLLQLNTEFTNSQADRVRKEAAYQSVSSGSLEAAQASLLGEPLRKLTERLNEIKEKFSEVQSHYGSAHPEYKKIAAQLDELQRLHDGTRQNIAQRAEIEYKEALNREAILKTSVQQAKSEFDRLNARSFGYQALKREAEADKNLYEELVRKIKEAGINASFQNSAIRIADPARAPLKPVFPNVKLNLVLAFLFAVLLAVGTAVVSDTLDNTIRDPEQVARTLNTEVLGSLPMVKKWKGRLGTAAQSGDGTAVLALGGEIGHSLGIYAEAVRSLRNSILLSDLDRQVSSLLITSASPGEGKSTVAAHLAATHASQGRRTLLIDGDMRRPTLHKRFRISAVIGLSNALLAEKSWKQVVVKLEHLPGLDVIPAGPPSRRATDLIESGLPAILEEALQEYDLVILDGPPLLGFAEPLQMATAVDGVLIVTRAGQTNRKAVAAVINTLKRLRANTCGIVLNQVNYQMSDSYSYYADYGKYYHSNATN